MVLVELSHTDNNLLLRFQTQCVRIYRIYKRWREHYSAKWKSSSDEVLKQTKNTRECIAVLFTSKKKQIKQVSFLPESLPKTVRGGHSRSSSVCAYFVLRASEVLQLSHCLNHICLRILNHSIACSSCKR